MSKIKTSISLMEQQKIPEIYTFLSMLMVLFQKPCQPKTADILQTTTASYCTNGASPILNTDDWSVSVNNLTVTNTKCTLYFKQSTIVDKIIAQLDKTGACPIVNGDGTVQVTAAESTNGYLCSAPDDYGTSYYYRGNVTNNYVKFGDYYWRIIRINGDGSIRLIYDGTSAHANGEVASNDNYRSIGDSMYNSSLNNDNAYVGYMYGTPGSDSYEATHANTHDSTIKAYLDNWYKTNIDEKNLSSYISDTLFCNDRSLSSANNGTGTGTSETYYRWYLGPWDNPEAQYPRLTCSQQNDQFTVNDEVTGNGDLTYPIGLITTDEVVLAGGYDTSNYGYYLYTGDYYWTMSPFCFFRNNASVRAVYDDDRIYFGILNNSYNARPTINLKADSLKSGSGTMNDPWRIADQADFKKFS